jgi:hypothetical protein
MTSISLGRPLAGQRSLAALLLAVGLAAGSAAHAGAVTDATGDILPSFRDDECPGCAFRDLDAQRVSAVFDGQTLHLTAQVAGNIGQTPDGLYVWGVDRGSGTEFLHNLAVNDPEHHPDVGQGVFFDAFAVIRPDETGTLFFLTPQATLDHFVDLAAGSVRVDGRTIRLNLDRSLLPSAGFDFADYRYNFWPRYDDITNNEQVADFAPDGSTFAASAPEPASWALMILGFGLGGATLRKRRALRMA